VSRFHLLALGAALALAGCGEAPPASKAGNSFRPVADVMISAAGESGASITMRVGQSLDVRRRGNSTVNPPDNWTVAETPSNLRAEGSTFQSDSGPGNEPAVGAGGTTIFRFVATTAGRGRLALSSGPSGKSFSVEVVTQ
jgi:hypothetical protein